MKTILRLYIFIVCCGFAIGAAGQSYTKLWKQAEEAQQKDLPQTALKVVEQIRQKASTEKNLGQTLKAMLVQLQLKADISPDSIPTYVEVLETALKKETNPAHKALLQSALGQVYQQMSWQVSSTKRDSVNRLSRQMLQASVENIEMLAQTRATDYLPVFNVGRDSKSIYHNDLLSVLLRTYLQATNQFSLEKRCEMAGKVISHYRKSGNRPATMMSQLDSVALHGGYVKNLSESPAFRRLLNLKDEYSDISLSSEVYKALLHFGSSQANSNWPNDSLLLSLANEGIRRLGKNKDTKCLQEYVYSMQQPRMNGDFVGTLYPEKSYTLKLNVTNVQHLRLLFIPGEADQIMQGKKTIKVRQLMKKACMQKEYVLPETPTGKEISTECAFTAPSVGRYTMVFCADNEILDMQTVSCTRLYAMDYAMGDSWHRIAVVDAETGRLLQGTRLREAVYKNNNRESVIYHEPDNQGFFYLHNPYDRKRHEYRAILENDSVMPTFSLNTTARIDTTKALNTYTKLFIDRGIYRPGQEVHFSAVCYTQRGDVVKNVEGKNLNVFLYDSNNKLVEKQVLTTDDFGHINGTFTLPKHCLPGNFRINATHASGVYFKVEEYKRPTFIVETDELQKGYAPGDTIYIKGVAKAYSGVPLAGAKVHYTHTRTKYVLWYRQNYDNQYKVQGDTLTDADGRFCIPLVLTTDMGANDRTFFTSEIEVFDMAGERVATEKTVAVSYQKGRLRHDLDKQINLDRDTIFEIRFNNAMNVNIPLTGHATIYRDGQEKASFTFKTGEDVALPVAQLPESGQYTMVYGVEYDGMQYVDTAKFTAFRETDTKLPEESTFWTQTYYNDRRDTVTVLLGTSKHGLTVFYDIYTGGERPAFSQQMLLSDTLLRMEIPYLPEYGDGAAVTFRSLWENSEKDLFFEISKPLPRKKLRLQWETFRSNLTLGQHETWKLSVKHADGTPANAAVVARMYDASLDALNYYRWNFNIFFPRIIQSASWQHSFGHDYYFSCDNRKDVSFTSSLVFTDWKSDLFNFGGRNIYNSFGRGGKRMYKTKNEVKEVIAYGVRNPALAATADDEDALEGQAAGVVFAETKAEARLDALEDEEDAEMDLTNEVRQNFAETAFFQPTLRTDASGAVNIEFTLPESLTQWNFQALANTKNMEYGELFAEAKAQKKVMVQPAMPRFLRQGDAPIIPVRLYNLTESAQQIQLICQLLDAETEKPFLTQKQKVKLAANGQDAAQFCIAAKDLKNHDAVIFRIVGKTSDFSDGEEHLLPILSDRELVISTLPFSLDSTGVATWRIDTLWSKSKNVDNKRLSVEISSNPVWYVFNALPVLANQECRSANEWMENLYAVTLAQFIAEENPEIRKLFEDVGETTGWQAVLERNADLKQILLAESPWLVTAENEKQRANAIYQLFDEYFMQLKHATALDHLKVLQQSDGSWSWYPSMPGNTYVTASILYHIARLKRMTASKDLDAMFDKGMKYMEQAATKQVKEMKKYGQKYCGEAFMKYLYARALTDRQAKGQVRQDIDFLVKALKEQVATADMHTKALSAVVLAFYNQDDAAKTTLQSLLEHTVSTPEMGRYFDTRRAPMTYSSYRMPTQTATIEALTRLGVGNKEAEEMCRWIMQSKRTQIWETSDATLDAIYTLMWQYGENIVNADSTYSKQTQNVQYTLLKGKKPVGFNAPSQAKGAQTVGYYKDSYESGEALSANTLKVRKNDKNLSWGSVYAQYTLPMNEVTRSGKGLHVERVLEVKQHDGWKTFNPAESLPKGTHIRMILRIESERDMDFVSLRAGRAACMEPLRPLSGYIRYDRGGTYRVVRDACTEYFFERLPKGRSEIVEECYLDRSGTYQCAPTKIQSVYSPEFAGVSGSSVVIRVKE